MKIGEDGVLLGAWAPIDGARHILDIGTGTGLLALMAAQRNPDAQITGVELDPDAAAQAAENAAASPWAARIRIAEADVRTWTETQRYDVMLCNPPYYGRGSAPPDARRALARHGATLGPEAFCRAAGRLLAPEGRCCLILPADEAKLWMRSFGVAGFFVQALVAVRSQAHKMPGRYLLSLGREHVPAERSELIIRQGTANQYSDEYIRLTSAFYLFM